MVELHKTLILFDIDGTVTDTKAVDDRCYLATLKELYSFEIDNVDWSSFNNVTDVGLTSEIYLQQKGRPISKTELSKVEKLFVKKIKSASINDSTEFTAVDGIQNFISELKSKNIPYAFATGGWRKTAEIKLQAAGIDYEGFTLATSNDASVRRSIINIAIARARFEFQREFKVVVYFGDGAWDAETCAAMNIPMIYVDVNKTSLVAGEAVKAVIHNYLNFDKILESVGKITKLYDTGANI